MLVVINYTVANTSTLVGINVTTAASCALSIQSNDFRGIICINKCSAQTYISNTAVTLSQNISNNTFTNLNVNTTGDIFY
jgi:hypothetical protein